ncbi:MAG: class III poly(R)-hydroxyalkanoic acid synthase subunit PhaE [Dokdonella sp.]|uniref:class III poly(R)-hydroxyalkanoic acid synthase subunit PhaE n=2 Tax=Dokdonella sp. TaxID=2291710 RepID=UPI0025BF395E|nr:class III poly(R)-hydroxyalkanoic acid synthase subunit PhaE [Dokdonella sp.]MBX3700591.1 class III poly(R)-hydroxyalkanoic acid synthase subunit PhaE [Dokdonella sp.]
MSEWFTSDAHKQWLAFLQQSGGPWAQFLRGGAPSTGAFEQWTALFDGAGGMPREAIERFVQGARDYVTFLQSSLGKAGTSVEGMAGWVEPLKRMFAGPAAGGAFEHPFARLWPGQMAAVNPFAAGVQLPSLDFTDLKSWLALPAFGPAREHQETQQKAALAWFEYQEQMARHNELMLKAAQRGFELFEGKLAEREQPGRQIDSLRALYDLWVDAAEEGYAEIALSQQYREVYGALVNAQMRVRSHAQREVERLSSDLGMPTRSEIDSIGERLQALRREVRALRGGDALVDEVAQLRDELAAAQRAAAAPAARAAAPAPAQRVAARRPARKPATTANKAGTARKSAPRTAAATASGGFATRIAQFADASLGGKRKARKATTTVAGAKRSGKRPGKR